MKHTEFWTCVDRAFPRGLGRGLAHDLFLPELGSTAEEALRNGREPQEVWHHLRLAMDLPDSAEFIYRRRK